MKYHKPRVYSTKFGLHGPCADKKTYLIPKGHLGDAEPNCRTIEAYEGWVRTAVMVYSSKTLSFPG